MRVLNCLWSSRSQMSRPAPGTYSLWNNPVTNNHASSYVPQSYKRTVRCPHSQKGERLSGKSPGPAVMRASVSAHQDLWLQTGGTAPRMAVGTCRVCRSFENHNKADRKRRCCHWPLACQVSPAAQMKCASLKISFVLNSRCGHDHV